MAGTGRSRLGRPVRRQVERGGGGAVQLDVLRQVERGQAELAKVALVSRQLQSARHNITVLGRVVIRYFEMIDLKRLLSMFFLDFLRDLR